MTDAPLISRPQVKISEAASQEKIEDLPQDIIIVRDNMYAVAVINRWSARKPGRDFFG